MDALQWLASQGAIFCRVSRYDDPGDSPGKRPVDKKWESLALPIQSIISHVSSGGNVGLICGEPSNLICMIDVDENFSAFLSEFPQFRSTPTITRQGADKGKLLIKTTEPVAPKKFKRPGDRSPFLEFLSTGNQGVIPPSTHPTGAKYQLINADQPIPVFTPDELDAIIEQYTGQSLIDDAPAPTLIKATALPRTNGDGLKEALMAYWDPYKVFEHFGKITKTRMTSRGEWLRLLGNGGLFVHVNGSQYDGWAMPGELGMGGGIFEAWVYCKEGTCSVPKGHAFYELMIEMAEAANIPIPEKARKHAEEGAQKKTERLSKPDDAELARRFMLANPNICYGLGDWRKYEAGYWKIIDSDFVARLVGQICMDARVDGIEVTSARLNSVMELARIFLATADKVWDQNKNLLVCTNGTLELNTRTLRPHSPDDHATTYVPYGYDPAAKPDMTIFAINSTVPEAHDFLQEFAGYSLTLETRYEWTIWLYGKPGCGKSSIVEAFQTMLGQDRWVKLSLTDIERSRFALWNMIGKTLAVATEQPSIYMQKSDTFNSIISGEDVTIERKFHDQITIKSTVKVLWAMNALPRVADPNDGVFRRVYVIEFPDMRPEDRDPRVKEEIRKEGPGLLNWALDGWERLQKRNCVAVPPSVKQASDAFKKDNDLAVQFVEECCIRGEGFTVGASQLYQAYSEWHRANGHKDPPSNVRMAKEWARLGLVRYDANGRRIYRGVGLVADKR